MLNNAKPVHKKLPSRAKIALRGLYSMLYQTYQTERIWVTLKVLADPKYTIMTYSKLRATVTETMQSFRNICREIASSMTMDMFNFIHTSDPTIPQALPATSQTTPVCKEGKKNSKCIPTRISKQIALFKVKVWHQSDSTNPPSIHVYQSKVIVWGVFFAAHTVHSAMGNCVRGAQYMLGWASSTVWMW